MTRPAPGEMAPDFEIVTDRSEPFRLSDHRGKLVVLFFYPTDDTELCTIENQEFSLLAADFAKLGVVLVGISPDSVESHCAFRDKYNLAVTLAADIEHKVVTAYGVWGTKISYGREIIGLTRGTVIVGADGKIARNFLARPVKGHAQKVLDEVRKLV